MKKETAVKPFSDIYREAWASCAALWPLFIARGILNLLYVGAILLCLLVTFAPFLKYLFDNLGDLEGSDYKRLFENFDFKPYVQDMNWWVLLGGVFFLYFTWLSLFEAFFDGASYRRYWDHQKNSAGFTWGDFFRDGLKFMLPMIGLQALFMGLFFGIIILPVFLIAFLCGLLKGASLLLLIPVVLIGLVFLVPAIIGLVGWYILSQAYLVAGNGVFESMKKAFGRCKERYGRVVWGIFLVGIIYFVVDLAVEGILGLFSNVPVIGIVFLVVKFLASMALSIVFSMYVPALGVTFLLEREEEA
jgi:hypothetical protein